MGLFGDQAREEVYGADPTAAVAGQLTPSAQSTVVDGGYGHLGQVDVGPAAIRPEDVDKAIALYADDIVWEAPGRGMVYTNAADVKGAYLDIFKTLTYHKTTALRRFATETFVFDDQIAEVTVVGDKMPNLPYPIGARMSVRLVHCFQMRDGQITREIAYELWRDAGGPLDNDDIPEGAIVELFDA